MNDNVTPLFKNDQELAEDLGELLDSSPQLVEAPAASDGEPEYHAILEVWRHMLDPEHQFRDRPPTPDWCAVLIARWPFLAFSDCGTVQDEYFKIFDIAHDILDQVYRDNPEAFDVDSRDEDVKNKDLYVHVLTEFQRALFVVQSEWSYDDPQAGAKMAALGEAQQQILGKDGIASYLGHIQLPFTEEEQAVMNQELNEFRESLGV